MLLCYQGVYFILQSTSEGPGKKAGTRELFEVSCVVTVWSPWNHLLEGSIIDYFLGLSTWRGRMIKNLSVISIFSESMFCFSISQVLMGDIYVGASGSHNTSCLWVNHEALGEGRMGDTGMEMKSWWIVNPWSWPESMQSRSPIARTRVLVTDEAWEDLKGCRRCWKRCLLHSAYNLPNCPLYSLPGHQDWWGFRVGVKS